MLKQVAISDSNDLIKGSFFIWKWKRIRHVTLVKKNSILKKPPALYTNYAHQCRSSFEPQAPVHRVFVIGLKKA